MPNYIIWLFVAPEILALTLFVPQGRGHRRKTDRGMDGCRTYVAYVAYVAGG